MRENRTPFREHVLASFGASPPERAELLAYNENVFSLALDAWDFPLQDEPFVAAWRQYARVTEDANSILPLANYLPQMQFPIQAGISQSPEYVAATRQGVFRKPRQLNGCGLIAPERCHVAIHPTSAGHIPLIIAELREDFITLLRALARKNEPVTVPHSMGAAMVAGYNNWHRINLLRQEYEAGGGGEWEQEFQRIKAEKSCYQDRFILLGRGPYSGVNARELELDEEEWLRLSLVIRREHECTHYFTRRVFSSMRNNLLDELIADYCGLTAAVGEFRPAWILRFLGLELFPHYRPGGRLENYRGNPPLSDAAFKILQRVMLQAVNNLEVFDRELRHSRRSLQMQAVIVATLTSFTLEEMASAEGAQLLRGKFHHFTAALKPDEGQMLIQRR